MQKNGSGSRCCHAFPQIYCPTYDDNPTVKPLTCTAKKTTNKIKKIAHLGQWAEDSGLHCSIFLLPGIMLYNYAKRDKAALPNLVLSLHFLLASSPQSPVCRALKLWSLQPCSKIYRMLKRRWWFAPFRLLPRASRLSIVHCRPACQISVHFRCFISVDTGIGWNWTKLA